MTTLMMPQKPVDIHKREEGPGAPGRPAGRMSCRAGCGACCIAISISSPIPGMPAGKPAGVRCVQLTAENLCRLYGQPGRPTVCSQLEPLEDICGTNTAEAMTRLTALELATRPESQEEPARDEPEI